MAVKKLAKKPAAAKKAAPKKTMKKPVVKAKASKKKGKSKRKPNAKFMAPLAPSAALAAIVGAKPLARTEAVKKLWSYIKRHELQDKKNKREINADDKLKAVVKKDKVSMFDLAKAISKHLS